MKIDPNATVLRITVFHVIFFFGCVICAIVIILCGGCDTTSINTRSSATQPTKASVAPTPYAETVTAPEPVYQQTNEVLSTSEVPIITQLAPDPAPPVTNHVRRIKPRWMSSREWAEYKARGYK